MRRWGLLAGTAATALLLGLGATKLIAQSGERSLSIYNIHTKETVTAVFKRNGRFVEAGLEQLSHVMRDHRRNEATKMDPELIDLLWEVHHELGSKEPIHLISGYRSRASNELLRRTVGGQASESRHILGKAADVHFPDVPLKQIRYAGLVHERGGVGYYPTSALPFVHLDTDRVRSWPRLPRHELALLFPSGSTRHAAADGGPITKDDVRIAQARHGELARQVAQFFSLRGQGGAPVAVADARPLPAPTPALAPARAQQPDSIATLLQSQPITAPTPALVEQPKAVIRPQLATLTPSSGDRAKLAELATLASTLPQLVSGPAPARRPEKPKLASLTGETFPVPPGAIAPLKPPAPERQVASLGPSAVESDTITDGSRFGWGGWVPAPAYDDEHPEELSYRPFPIVPYLTESASQPLMTDLVAHDVARTLDVLDQPEPGAGLRFRPTAQVAGVLWAQTFTGTAINTDRMKEAQTPADAGLKSRAVKTSQR